MTRLVDPVNNSVHDGPADAPRSREALTRLTTGRWRPLLAFVVRLGFFALLYWGSVATAHFIRDAIARRTTRRAAVDVLTRAARQRMGITAAQAENMFGPASFTYGGNEVAKLDYVFMGHDSLSLEVVRLNFDEQHRLFQVVRHSVGASTAGSPSESVRTPDRTLH